VAEPTYGFPHSLIQETVQNGRATSYVYEDSDIGHARDTWDVEAGLQNDLYSVRFNLGFALLLER
jgi:hypothetical protein